MPLSTFARMRTSYFILANFASRQPCLCIKHQNISLKLRELKHHIPLSTNLDTFVKTFDKGEFEGKISELGVVKISFQIWKKISVETIDRSGKMKTIKRMKKLTENATISDFQNYFFQ